MGFRICRTLDSQQGVERLKTTRTRVMTSPRFWEPFEMFSIHTNTLSYNDASFPVRPDLSSPRAAASVNTGRKLTVCFFALYTTM